MKHILTIIALVLCGSLQAQWYPVNSNTTENLNDIFFIDSLTGYCVGGPDAWGASLGNGVILKTTDGGENWSTIFSYDSVSIQHVAVVNENNNIAFYGFALKNGLPYLVTTSLSAQFQNWTVAPTSYSAKDVQVIDNVIYLIDALDQSLKTLQNGTPLSLVNDVSFFSAKQNSLVWVNQAVDSVFVSLDNGSSIALSKKLPQEMSQNQSTNALVSFEGDTLLIKGTYPGLVTFTTPNALGWTTNIHAPDFQSAILSSTELYGMDNLNRLQVTTNSGGSWHIVDSIGARVNRLYFYTNSLGFAVGENGTIYKTSNATNFLGLRATESLRRRVEIFPNPANNRLSFTIPSDLRIKNIYLTNSTGQKMNTPMPNQQEMNLSNIPQGVYFLTFETEEGIQTEKIVVVK